MARQANGTYIQPANTAAVSGQTISSTAFNTLITDVGTEITNSLDRQGRSAMQANLPMGGNKATGAADPTSAQDLATKNYVDTSVAAFFSTGDFKPTIKTTPDSGWLMCDDGTFGSASSGSSNSNSASNLALFTLMFNNLSDSAAPLLTSGGGATTRAGQTNAATAWAANCRMTLPKMLGRVLGAAGAGSGLTSRALGSALGEETHLLTTGEMPSHNHAVTDPGHTHTISGGNGVPWVGGSGSSAAGGGAFTMNTGSINSATTGISIQNAGSGGVHNNMQPSTFINWMIKQ